MSTWRSIIRNTFGGKSDLRQRVVEYAGSPNNNLTIDSTTPFGKGVLCYDTTNEVTYYKTDTDATDWTLID